ncbi:trigger factor [Planctomycetales bacterium]|nr:trigger factor [Planctomycetales bacterium]
MSEQEEIKSALEFTTDIQTVSSCERKIKVSIARSEIDRYYQNEYSELEKEAYVPGFRAGKAPRQLIEKRFRKDVSERVKQALVLDALTRVNGSDDFTAISEPEFDYDSLILADEGPFVFEFSIEVRPEFDLPNWKGLRIEKPVKEFSPEDIDKAVSRVLQNYGTLETKSEPAQPNDYIVTRLTFKDGEKELSSVAAETIRIRPTLSFHDGSIQDFDKLIAGKKAGDVVETKVTLTEGAANPEYRNKTVDAVFEISEVKELIVPTISSDFLERIGGFKDEGDFRDAIQDSLKRQLEHEQNRKARQQITSLLTVTADWELPPGLLKRQSERELRRIVLELQRSGYAYDDIQARLNVIRQNNEIATAQALKEHFILEKIAEVENVEATESDYETEIALIAAQSGQSPRRVRAQIEKSGEMDILNNQIVERKVINLINENAKFVEVPFEWEPRDEEALDWAAAGDPDAIGEATAEDLKAVHKELEAKKNIDPNVKIK